MITKIVIAVIAMLIAWASAYEVTLKTEIKRRGSAYFVCVLCVLAYSVAMGAIAAAAPESGDEPGMPCEKQNELITNIFLVTIIPALIGVRFGLGNRGRETQQ